MGSTTIFSVLPPDFFNWIIVNTGKSVAGLFWQVVLALWAMYWPYILAFLFCVVVYELITRNGNAHYNSANGFSPDFNRLVGAGVYVLFQAITLALIHFLGGNNAYDEAWAWTIHLFVFAMTKIFLLAIGFWVY